MIKITVQILFGLDRDEVTGLVIDFKKAFDVVDHQILLKKLKLYRAGTLPYHLSRTCQNAPNMLLSTTWSQARHTSRIGFGPCFIFAIYKRFTAAYT